MNVTYARPTAVAVLLASLGVPGSSQASSITPIASVLSIVVTQPAPKALVPPPPAGTVSFLHLSDVHLDLNKHHAGPRHNHPDTSTQLWASTKKKLTEILTSASPPQFILYTGDLPAHYPAQGGRHDANMENVLEDLAALAGNVPVLYLPGNNDSLCGDYCSFANYEGETVLDLDEVDDLGYPAINATMLSSEPEMGYYCASPVAGLRVIALNSIILGKKYIAGSGPHHETAGDDQIEWLGKQLRAAEHAGDKVLIGMHIPPGIDAYKNQLMWHTSGASTSTWQDELLDMMRLYGETVVGVAYGHTHMDELRLLRGKPGSSPGCTILEVAISAPGITMGNGNNPGFKLVYYDPSTFEIRDFVTYYASDPTVTTWPATDYYTFSGMYGCSTGTILDCLRQSCDSKTINGTMATRYKVGKPASTSFTGRAIDVTYGQRPK